MRSAAEDFMITRLMGGEHAAAATSPGAQMTVDEACDRPDQAGLLQAGAVSLADLFRQHHAELVRLAVLMLRSQAAAEDVVQDVFTQLQARPGRRLRSETALAYLRAAVLNGCRSTLRRQALWRRIAAVQDPPVLTQASAEHEAIKAEQDRDVLAALNALPPRRREVLVLRYYLDLSEAEIASTLGISRGTVKSTAARGIAALAQALGEES
jgi:RNA polymerase sigma-70 factor (sigma-E family)